MVSIMENSAFAMFEGQLARHAGEPRDVPKEHHEAAEYWLRGWDRVNYLIEQQQLEPEREAQEEEE
tara:strand:+ start:2109 stop:2306 length:198 start_codon:yes stop_codon:yes gene_type:complete